MLLQIKTQHLCYKSCIISNAATNKDTTFAINNPVLNLSTQDNAKLLHQLKSGFTRTKEHISIRINISEK